MSDQIETKIYNEMKAIGAALKSHVTRENLTNKAIQSNTGMAINTIKSVLSGEAGNIKSYAAIAKIFNVSLFELVDEAKKYLPDPKEPAPSQQVTSQASVDPATQSSTPVASLVDTAAPSSVI